MFYTGAYDGAGKYGNEMTDSNEENEEEDEGNTEDGQEWGKWRKHVATALLQLNETKYASSKQNFLTKHNTSHSVWMSLQ